MSTASGHVTTSQKKIHLVIHKKKKGRRLGAMVMCNEMDMLRGKTSLEGNHKGRIYRKKYIDVGKKNQIIL